MTHKYNFAKTLASVVTDRRNVRHFTTQYHRTRMTVEREIEHYAAAESHGVPLVYIEPFLLTGWYL